MEVRLFEREGEVPTAAQGSLVSWGLCTILPGTLLQEWGALGRLLFKGWLDRSCMTAGDTRLGTGLMHLERGAWPWDHPGSSRNGSPSLPRHTDGKLSPGHQQRGKPCAARGTGPSFLEPCDPAVATGQAQESETPQASLCAWVTLSHLRNKTH